MARKNSVKVADEVMAVTVKEEKASFVFHRPSNEELNRKFDNVEAEKKDLFISHFSIRIPVGTAVVVNRKFVNKNKNDGSAPANKFTYWCSLKLFGKNNNGYIQDVTIFSNEDVAEGDALRIKRLGTIKLRWDKKSLSEIKQYSGVHAGIQYNRIQYERVPVELAGTSFCK